MKKKIYLMFVWLFAIIAYSQAQGPVIENGVLKSWADATGEITIPDEVVEIAPDVFLNNKKVTALHLNNVQIAGKNSCRNMSGVMSFSAPNLKIANDSAFYRLGSFRAFRFRELVLPEATELHSGSLELTFEYRRIYLPKIEVLKPNSLAVSTLSLIDMSQSESLTEVAENAFSTKAPFNSKRYIVVSDSAALQLLPQDFGNDITITRVANFKNQQPQIIIQVKQTFNNQMQGLNFGSNNLHDILGIDMGDGFIRAIPMEANAWGGGASSSEFMNSYFALSEDPILKLYGTVSFLTPMRWVLALNNHLPSRWIL